MRWYKIDKPYKNKQPKVGDKKIKKHFCLFPKSYYRNGVTTYFWLETIYIVYERKESYIYRTQWSTYDVQPDYWEQIGIANSYSAAIEGIWW